MAQLDDSAYTVELDRDERAQNEEAFTVRFDDGRTERMRIHDYGRVYSIPGLYEEVVQGLLECASPATVAAMVLEAARAAEVEPRELRVLDLGAGNGVVADELAAVGVETMVGLDDVPEARAAALRDRPRRYAAYVVETLPELDAASYDTIVGHQLNCLVCVGALGFDDIPGPAFERALELCVAPTLLGFTVHEDFLDEDRPEGLGGYIAELESSGRLEVAERRRFRHRLSTAGTPLHYVAVVGWLR